MTVQTAIDHLLDYYPSIYGNNPLKALQFLVIGSNDLEWDSEGEIHCTLKTPLQIPSRRRVHAEAMALLKTIPLVTEIRERGILNNHELIWEIPEEHAHQAYQWREFEFPKSTSAEVQLYLKSIATRPIFSEIHPKQLPVVTKLPKNIQKKSLEMIECLLTSILAQPTEKNHPRMKSHASAEALLIHHKTLFTKLVERDGKAEQIREEIRRIQNESKKTMLELDKKRHVSSHQIDESNWSDREFFQANYLSTNILDSEEIKLVRKYRQYLTWQKADVRKTWVAYKPTCK